MKHVEQNTADFSCTKVVIYVALTVLAVLNVVTGVFCGLSWIWQAFFGYFFGSTPPPWPRFFVLSYIPGVFNIWPLKIPMVGR